MEPFPCEYCEKEYDSERGLKSHLGLKHKDELLWHDDEWVYRSYCVEGKSTPKMADIAGCDIQTILNKIDDLGISKRSPWEYTKKRPLSMRVDERGYENFVSVHQGETSHVGHHQLLAIAKGHDPREVFDENNHVHHSPVELPWLNIESNISLVKAERHNSEHSQKEAPHRKIAEYIRKEGPVTSRDVAEVFEIRRETASHQLRELGDQGTISVSKRLESVGKPFLWEFNHDEKNPSNNRAHDPSEDLL
jgi:hypothetical protein